MAGSYVKYPAEGGAGVNSYPEVSDSAGGVVATWYFDEASGNITDTTSSIVLTATGTSYYEVMAQDVTEGGLFKNWAPGICCPQPAAFFRNTTVTGIDPGTGDYTVEWVFACTRNDISVTYALNLYSASNYGIAIIPRGNNGGIQYLIRATDGTQVSTVVTGLSTNYQDGDIHKIRLVMDRTAAVKQLWLDGVKEDETSIASLAGKTIQVPEIGVNVAFTGAGGGSYLNYILRLSNNAINNFGGPGGG